jgi:hypothetical protein
MNEIPIDEVVAFLCDRMGERDNPTHIGRKVESCDPHLFDMLCEVDDKRSERGLMEACGVLLSKNEFLLSEVRSAMEGRDRFGGLL